MNKTIAAAMAFGFALCAVAPSARAQTPKKDGKDYAYDFPDDKLLTADGTGTLPIIKVRPGPRRDLLLRPRIQFVQEMLKSVENM